jgi:hypothetical protein
MNDLNTHACCHILDKKGGIVSLNKFGAENREGSAPMASIPKVDFSLDAGHCEFSC